jgi:hypothetical protein
MKLLIGCECSGIIRDAFRRLGHNAWSCDLKPCDRKSKFHIQDDVRKVALDYWDMGIFHPVCKKLANSGVRWLHERNEWDELEKAIEFFNFFLSLDHIPKTVVENPIQHKYARMKIPKYTQIIQPTDFGHTTRKATCLWLKGLEPLKPTWRVPKEFWTDEIHKMPPGPEREANRSRTFQGIAIALADQYGRDKKEQRLLTLFNNDAA